MKRYLKGLSLLLAGLSVFVACNNEDTIEKATWDANENYANIYFKGTSESHEFAPTDECKVTLKVYRRDSLGALTVNLEPTINTDDVFTVGPAVFADKDTVATFDVTFPNAEIGKTYTLQLSSTDPNLVSSWSQGIVYNLDIIRVKWNYLGQGTIWDWFPYTFNDHEGKVDIYQRDDDHNKFRLNNIFEDIAANAGVALTGNQTTEAYLTIFRKGDVYEGVTITQAGLVGYDDMNTGYVHPSYGAEVWYVHPAGFSSLRSEDNWYYNKVLGYQDNGLPTQIQLAPLYYMNGVGGYNYSQYNDDVIITFPGYEPVVTYEAYFEPYDEDGDDFEWSDVKTFDFTNTVTGEVRSNVMLKKATCKVNTDNCDETFLANYGVPYCLVSPFVDGYDIYFFVKNNKVIIPDDYAYDFELQETGMTADPLQTAIYAAINTEDSYFTTVGEGDDVEVKEINLNMSFYDKKGKTSFGTANMLLNNVSWTKVATGTYYYVMFSENEDGSPEADPGYELYKRDDKDNVFKITDWLMGTDFMFTWDKATNACEIPLQEIGYEHPNYGMMYIIEGANYNPDKYGEHTSYYDPETKVFHFFPAYVVEAGSFGQVEELFEITEEAAVKRQAPLKFGNAKLNTSIKKNSPWKAVKLAEPRVKSGSKSIMMNVERITR